MSDKMYLKNAAAYLNKAPNTLQKWDRDGKLVAHRTQNNRRYYYQDEYLNKDIKQAAAGKVIVYASVSSNSQKDDLQDQISFLRQFINAREIIADEYISDISSGLNYKRPKWLKLIKEIDQNKIKERDLCYLRRSLYSF